MAQTGAPNWARFGVDCRTDQRECQRSEPPTATETRTAYPQKELTMTTGRDEIERVATEARDLLERGLH